MKCIFSLLLVGCLAGCQKTDADVIPRVSSIHNVVVVSDGGLDDLRAILMIEGSPNLRLLGVVVEAGETSVAAAAMLLSDTYFRLGKELKMVRGQEKDASGKPYPGGRNSAVINKELAVRKLLDAPWPTWAQHDDAKLKSTFGGQAFDLLVLGPPRMIANNAEALMLQNVIFACSSPREGACQFAPEAVDKLQQNYTSFFISAPREPRITVPRAYESITKVRYPGVVFALSPVQRLVHQEYFSGAASLDPDYAAAALACPGIVRPERELISYHSRDLILPATLAECAKRQWQLMGQGRIFIH